MSSANSNAAVPLAVTKFRSFSVIIQQIYALTTLKRQFHY